MAATNVTNVRAYRLSLAPANSEARHFSIFVKEIKSLDDGK